MDAVGRRDLGTGVLATVAIAVVFAAAGGRIPSHWLPEAPAWVIAAIPHVNAVLSVSAILTIAAGWRTARRGAIDRHRAAMGLAVFLFGGFLVLYLYRLVILGGPTPFDGSMVVYRFVYLPLLAIHILLAVVCIPLVFDALALAITTPRQKLPRTRHPTVGRLAATLWIISFALGLGVYLLLYWV